MTNIYSYIVDLEEMHISKCNELSEAKEQLLKATQCLNFIMWRSRDDWQGFPTHIVLGLLRELPKLPEPSTAEEA